MKIVDKFTKTDFQLQYNNWQNLNTFIKDEVYGKEITVEVCKNILKQFHTCCMETTNNVCNLMMSLNVDSEGHSTGDKCEKCPLKKLCVKGDCDTHEIYCGLSKLCLDIMRKREITNEEVVQVNTYIENLIEIETRDFGLFQNKSNTWGK